MKNLEKNHILINKKKIEFEKFETQKFHGTTYLFFENLFI